MSRLLAILGIVLTLHPNHPNHHHHHRAVRHHHRAAYCTAANWRTLLGPIERWIDYRESGLDPTEVQPDTQAMGLGQLEPGTYTAIGLTPSFDPCAEIHAQRVYMLERYGSWGNAQAHWLTYLWW